MNENKTQVVSIDGGFDFLGTASAAHGKLLINIRASVRITIPLPWGGDHQHVVDSPRAGAAGGVEFVEATAVWRRGIRPAVGPAAGRLLVRSRDGLVE